MPTLPEWSWILLRLRLFLILILFPVASPVVAEMVRYDLQIPVPEDTWLAADLYTPDIDQPLPVIFIQTPYGKFVYRLQGLPLDTEDYAIVIMDWRGFFASSHAAQPFTDHGEDGATAIDWIADQEWCNGDVGTWGGSALGMVQFMTAREQPEDLLCAVPMIRSLHQHYEMYYPGGVLRREYVDRLTQIWPEFGAIVQQHPTRDTYWQLYEASNDFADEIQVPMLLISGWWDLNPDGVIASFNDLATNSHPDVRDQHRLMMGPWSHTTVDEAEQGEWVFEETVNAAHDEALAFFDYHLRGIDNGYEDQPRVSFFQGGVDQFVQGQSFPPEDTTTSIWYVNEDALAGYRPPGGLDRADTLAVDPRNPLPTLGGRTFHPELTHGPADMSPWLGRGDALFYLSPGAFDEPMQVVGDVRAKMYVSTDAPDGDLALLLVDVAPDGTQRLVTDGIRRFRHRVSFEEEELLPPGEIAELQIHMQTLAHTFQAGHHIGLYVTGSNAPRFAINPNDGTDPYSPEDTLSATHTIYRSSEYPSALYLTVRSLDSEIPASQPAAIPSQFSIQTYPNPFNGVTNVRFSGVRGQRVEMTLFNITGRSIWSRTLLAGPTGEGSVPLLLEGMSSGTYLLEVRDGSGASATRRITLLR